MSHRTYKTVPKEEFEIFLLAFPGKLEYSVSHISDPPMGFWCDLSGGKVWPEAIVARVALYEGDTRLPAGTPNEYEIVQMMDTETTGC